MTTLQTVSSSSVSPSIDESTDMGPRFEGELERAPNGEVLVGEDLEGRADAESVEGAEDEGGVATPLAEDEVDPSHSREGQHNSDEWLSREIEEEAEPKRIAPSPVLPTAAEIEDHRITHFPYRDWCPHCVAARGLGERRGAKTPEWQYKRHMIPIVALDYFYLTGAGMKTKKELKDDGYINV